MRYALISCAGFLAACSPDIANQAYLCGAEESCPDGFTCDAETVSCVRSDTVTTYSCISPNATLATAADIGQVTCGVRTVEDASCITTGGEAWYKFTVMTGCNVSVDAQFEVASPLAFAPLTVELRDAAGATVIETAKSSCPNVAAPDKTGEYAYCINTTLTPGMSYTVHIAPTGEANCGGNCNFNTFRFDISASP